MVEHCVHIGREHTLIGIVYLNGRIGPPEKRLGQRRTIRQPPMYFKVSTPGVQRKTYKRFLVEHPFHLVAPNSGAAIFSLFNDMINREEGGWAVVLRPVELNAAADPGPGQSDEGGFYHMIVVNEMTLSDLVEGHLHASAQFGQDHHFDVFVL